MTVATVTTAPTDKTQPYVLSSTIGISDSIQRIPFLATHVKMQMKATIGFNVPTVAIGNVGNIINGLKTGITFKNGGKELFARDSAIFLSAPGRMIGKGLIITIAGFGFEFDAETTVRTDIVRTTVIKENAVVEVSVSDKTSGAIVIALRVGHVRRDVTFVATGTSAKSIAVSASLTHMPPTITDGAGLPIIYTFVAVRAEAGISRDTAGAEQIVPTTARVIAPPSDVH
jgi:hypothetical protein